VPDKDVPALAKVKYSPSTAHQPFPGDIQTHLCIANDNQCEANEVLKLIQSIHAKQADAQIAVLARKRTPLALLAAGLRQADMAFESIELETLADQSIVQDIISLTGVFLQPMDTLAWLAVLRAPWCGASLNDLTILRASNKPVMEMLADIEILEGLSQPGRRQLQRIASIINPLDQTDETTPLNERIYCAWLRLRAPACYQKHVLDHAERFFKVLESLEADPEGLSPAHLLEVCTQQKTSSPESNLKLMTFHKAKGLEFDQVILTGLAGKSGGDNRSSALLYHTELDDHLLLAPCPESGESLPTKANFIKQQQKSIEDEEIARLLYVAVTRAKTQLYLFGTLKRTTKGEISSPQQGSLLKLLWPGCQQAFKSSEMLVDAWNADDSQTSSKIERPGIPLSSLPTPLPPLELPESIHFTPQSIPQQDASVEFDWAQEDARIIGLAVHQLLQFTDATQLKRWENHIDTSTIRARLAASGLIAERMGPATDRVSNILRTMANDVRAAWLFDDKHVDINAEWSLNCQQNETIANYVIDRSFIDQAGIRWIIDFKTSAHEGGDIKYFLDQEERRYAAQLDQYAQLVKKLEPTREIRLGLYFPAL
ncbi:MAG: hypothetical protein KAG66_18185, partial [Methylococcales bacterium]|nr:hypothetical protein [Methylococcales bacterium]